jgi:hypothetical protein
MVRRMVIRTIARESVADLDFSSMIARHPMRISALRLLWRP